MNQAAFRLQGQVATSGSPLRELSAQARPYRLCPPPPNAGSQPPLAAGASFEPYRAGAAEVLLAASGIGGARSGTKETVCRRNQPRRRRGASPHADSSAPFRQLGIALPPIINTAQ